jgi:hypothetical protein
VAKPRWIGTRVEVSDFACNRVHVGVSRRRTLSPARTPETSLKNDSAVDD